MSEAKVFESKVARLEAKASIFAAKTLWDVSGCRRGPKTAKTAEIHAAKTM
jgi:hypothetical protein